jgi:hypothetical protein
MKKLLFIAASCLSTSLPVTASELTVSQKAKPFTAQEQVRLQTLIAHSAFLFNLNFAEI